MSRSKVTSRKASGRAATLSGGGLTADDVGRQHRLEDVDLVRLADEQPAVGRGQHVEPARAALGHRPPAGASPRPPSSARWASARRSPAGSSARRRARRTAGCPACVAPAAEGDRLDVGVEGELDLGPGMGVELDDLPRVGPGDGPEAAVGGERQAGDAQVLVAAELGEGVGRRVEDLDALARGDVEPIGRRGRRPSASVTPSPNWLTMAPVVGSSWSSGPPPVVAQSLPFWSKAIAKIWYGRVASGVPAGPPFLGIRKSSLRAAPPLTRMVPSAASARAIGPRMPSLWSKPVANDWAWNGWRTVWNSDGLAGRGRRSGPPCWAWVNSGLVEGATVGAGGMPKLGGGRVGDGRQAAEVGRRRVSAARSRPRAAARGCRPCRSPAPGMVGVAGLALVDHGAGRLGHLVLPDLIGAAVLRDVERHGLHARAAGVVGARPLHLIARRGPDGCDGQPGSWGRPCRGCTPGRPCLAGARC